MELNRLTAISPVDGRYRGKVEELGGYFSEYALIRYRVEVEVEYFIALCELPLPQLAGFDRGRYEALRDIYRTFGVADAERVKTIEQTTNHDVKAVEYFIKEKMDALGLGDEREFVHFGLTSQDVNNTATPYSLKAAMEAVYYPAVIELRDRLAGLADEWSGVPMLAHTHGQRLRRRCWGRRSGCSSSGWTSSWPSCVRFPIRRSSGGDREFQCPCGGLSVGGLGGVRQPVCERDAGAGAVAVHDADRTL